MKSILAFGDSLTWGFRAGEWTRHAYEDRWPNVLAAGLSGKARVVEEGHNGRTTVFDDPTCFDNRNGATALPTLLATHQPLDLVIIMLGTNDIKYANRCRAFDAAMGMTRLTEIVQKFSFLPSYTTPQVLLMSPPALCKTVTNGSTICGGMPSPSRSSSPSIMPMWPRRRTARSSQIGRAHV